MRQAQTESFSLGRENRNTSLDLRGFDGDSQSPAKAGFEAFLEAVNLFRIAIAAEDYLLTGLEKGIEGVKKLFLRSLFSREELNIVNEEHVEGAVTSLEFPHRVALQRHNHIAHKAFRMNIGHATVGILAEKMLANRVHEMRFAQTDTAIDKQGVVSLARVVGNGVSGRTCNPVAPTFNEVGKDVIAIKRTSWDRERCRLVTPSSDLTTHAGWGFLVRADDNGDVESLTRDVGNDRVQAWKVVLADTVRDQGVGRLQRKSSIGKAGLERSQPKCDFPLPDIPFEDAETFVPEHAGIGHRAWRDRSGWRSVDPCPMAGKSEPSVLGYLEAKTRRILVKA